MPQPTRNSRPASGGLPLAILLMADRMAESAKLAATHRRYRSRTALAEAVRLQRAAARQSRALERLVFALADQASGREDTLPRAGYRRGEVPSYGAHDTGSDIEGEPVCDRPARFAVEVLEPGTYGRRAKIQHFCEEHSRGRVGLLGLRPGAESRCGEEVSA